MSASRETAEVVALKALRWLCAHEELLPVFLGASGASLDDLRENASDPETLGAVLDFLLMDETWLQAFCTQEGLTPSEPGAARAMLPGGATMHWT
ncbi:DUF3572 domain-containing protein [Alkalilacustris brevis]|uniref:DUF3572 domain-containing protein n=1 Tax=Alkalilacustris brevis TaxID=2026338 RepID=UPI000E0DDE48|nr:DUF3572 domain-containing protein [Alkalilacustris brevis]